MIKQRIVEDWLSRAQSNIAQAKKGKNHPDIMLEDLCYNCHQAVENSLKALLTFFETKIPRAHSLTRLFALLEENTIPVPQAIKDSIILSDYSFQTRFPGTYEPIKNSEYEDAVEIASLVNSWVVSIIRR